MIPTLILVVAAVDLTLVALAYVALRAYPRLDRRTLLAIGAGQAGFVFHAFLFFEGAFLILQLATISGLFGLCSLHHLGRLSRHEASD